MLVRLVDLASREVVVESPLLDDSPAAEPKARVVWRSDFSSAALVDLNWPISRGKFGISLRTDPQLGEVACFAGHLEKRHPILIRAKPLSRYRLTRLLRTDRPSLDLRVVESSESLSEAKAVNGKTDLERMARGAFVGKASTLAVHRFAPSASSGDWNRAEIDFDTSLDTRTLAILFESGGPPEPADATACLAELTLEALRSEPAADLALLRAVHPGPKSSGLGLVKRGALLPRRRLAFTRPPYDENYEVRDALFAPAPTRLRFPLHVPPSGRLTFSYGLSSGSRIGDEVEFEIVVEHRAQSRTMFGERAAIGPGGRGWHWRSAAVELEAWSGEDIVLELRTRSSTARGFGLWANPIIDSPRMAKEPPNVVVVGIDTLRADRVSSYGYPRATTPNLDRLATEGIRFDQAVSASNWTTPSFASIFTGLPVARHGLVDQKLAMSEEITTLAEHLRAGGWRTHAIVYKAALFGLGLEQGFDRWFNLPTSNRIAQDNLDKALAWLEDHHDRRFFLFLHLDDPHQPFNQPAPFDLAFGDAAAHEELGVELPISIRNSKIVGCAECMGGGAPRPSFVPVARDLYDGAVAYTDDRIGALLAALARHGIYEETIVVVVADHGEMIYDRAGAWGHSAVVLADELVRVPLIVKPASGASFDSGKVVEAQVRTTDLLPTLLQLAGLDGAAENIESRSLWALASGREEEERVAFVENPARGVIGVRTRDWKYTVRTSAVGPLNPALFDLRTDPGELVNLARQRPQKMTRWTEELARFVLRTRSGPFVLVVGDGAGGSFELVVGPSGGVGLESFVGLPPRVVAQGGAGDVPVHGRVLALIRLDLAPGQATNVSLFSGGRQLASRAVTLDELDVWVEGDLERLARQPTPAIYGLMGSPPLDAPRSAATTHPDQLDDLRALGYID